MATTLETIAASGGEAFYRGALAAAMVAHSRAHGGAHTLQDFADHTCRLGRAARPRLSRHARHELPPNGQGIAALHRAGHPCALRLRRPRTSIRPRCSIRHIEAMKLAFADVYRYVGDPRSMDGHARSRCSTRATSAPRARLIDRQAGAGIRARHAAARRHGLPRRRRRERHDGVAHPVQLHGLRLGHRRARHRHQPAEPRHRVLAQTRPPELRRAGQAAVPHHHPGIRHAATANRYAIASA